MTRCRILLLAMLCIGAPLGAATPPAAADAADHIDELCQNSTLHAKSDGAKIELDGASYPIDAFGAELAKRYRKAPFRCVEIVGPGQETRRVAKYLEDLDGADVSIGWRVDAPEPVHDVLKH
jgi:hypothetical protein